MKNLKLLRKLNKISQDKLANMIGASRSSISMWESGENEPDFATVIKIADIFGVTVDYLIGHESKSEKSENPLTDKELALITAYRGNPAMQGAVDKLLGIPSEPASDLVEDIVSELLPKPTSVQK